MVSIPEKVEEIINASPYLREAVTVGVVNLSALARQIRPQVEKELMKQATQSAIFIALQRYAREQKPYYGANPGHYLGNLALRTDLFEVTVKNSPTLMARLAPLLSNVQHDRSVLFVFTQGIYETTVIASKSLEHTINNALKDEMISSQLDNLTAISLQRMHEHIEAIGVLMYPLRIVAWQGISVIEIVTTLNELMIVVRNKDVDRAVVSIRQALQSAKDKPYIQ